jgi:isopenicillin-N epimerase
LKATTMPPFDNDWELDSNFLTVNHGSFGATPHEVRAAQRTWQDQMERQPSRFMNTIYPTAIRDAADALGSFLNVRGGELVFVDNATTGCNAVLRHFSLQPGDCVTILNHTYGAIRNTVRFVTEQAGARMVEADVGFPDPTENKLTTAILNTITPNTRLAVVDHITCRFPRSGHTCSGRWRPRTRADRSQSDGDRRRLVRG